MNASDLIRQIQSQATLAGFNNLLLKERMPTAAYDLSNCSGFFDTSSCSFEPNPPTNQAYSITVTSSTTYRPSPITYPSYEYRALVAEGLQSYGYIPQNESKMVTQPVVIQPNLIYTVPLNS
jgi:hypothetical protein